MSIDANKLSPSKPVVVDDHYVIKNGRGLRPGTLELDDQLLLSVPGDSRLAKWTTLRQYLTELNESDPKLKSRQLTEMLSAKRANGDESYHLTVMVYEKHDGKGKKVAKTLRVSAEVVRFLEDQQKRFECEIASQRPNSKISQGTLIEESRHYYLGPIRKTLFEKLTGRPDTRHHFHRMGSVPADLKAVFEKFRRSEDSQQ